MRVAFYAPMKAPDHPTPSGDRLLARLLMAALAGAGHEAFLASRLCSRDPGDPARQSRLRDIGRALAARLLRQWRRKPGSRPQAWFTYHLYHKAPDWIGPAVSRELGIPYLLAEASYTPSQASGPYAIGLAGVEQALEQARVVFNFNPEDRICLRPRLRSSQRLVELAPFLDLARFDGDEPRTRRRDRLARRYSLDSACRWLVCSAMMRRDVKRDSYRILADALTELPARGWQLIVAGDGPARIEIETWFSHFGDRVRFVGELDERQVITCLEACDLFVWPAVGEAFGMAVLEAQAAGLPALVGDRPGLRPIVIQGSTGIRVTEGDALLFGRTIRELLAVPAQLESMGRHAAAKARRDHSIATAGRMIDSALRAALATT